MLKNKIGINPYDWARYALYGERGFRWIKMKKIYL